MSLRFLLTEYTINYKLYSAFYFRWKPTETVTYQGFIQFIVDYLCLPMKNTVGLEIYCPTVTILHIWSWYACSIVAKVSQKVVIWSKLYFANMHLTFFYDQDLWWYLPFCDTHNLNKIIKQTTKDWYSTTCLWHMTLFPFWTPSHQLRTQAWKWLFKYVDLLVLCGYFDMECFWRANFVHDPDPFVRRRTSHWVIV